MTFQADPTAKTPKQPHTGQPQGSRDLLEGLDLSERDWMTVLSAVGYPPSERVQLSGMSLEEQANDLTSSIFHADCASSDNLGHLSGFPFGGSGSSLI
ncbi:MAG: hypothetical protein ACP5EN_12905, partial [Rhodovulum sp.]